MENSGTYKEYARRNKIILGIFCRKNQGLAGKEDLNREK